MESDLKVGGLKCHLMYKFVNSFNRRIVHTFYRSYFPLRQAKTSPFMQSSMKITFIFSHNLFQNFNVVATCKLFALKLSSDFLTRFKYLQIILKFVELTFPFHQSELRTYTKIVPFKEKSSFRFVVL